MCIGATALAKLSFLTETAPLCMLHHVAPGLVAHGWGDRLDKTMMTCS